MEWTNRLRVHQRINRTQSIRFHVSLAGARFFFVHNGYLIFTALYASVEEGESRFLADYERQAKSA